MWRMPSSTALSLKLSFAASPRVSPILLTWPGLSPAQVLVWAQTDPQAWYSRFATYLTTLGFIEAKSDTSLFIFRHSPHTVYLLHYVDDIILTTSSTELLRRTISALQREFVMKDLRPLHHFLDITVERGLDGMFLH
jgi:hypothetical protein